MGAAPFPELYDLRINENQGITFMVEKGFISFFLQKQSPI